MTPDEEKRFQKIEKQAERRKPDDWIQCPNCKRWDERWLVDGAECCIQKAKDEAEDAYYET